MNDGYCVHLANPAAIRQYQGLKYSGDFADAAHLAQLLRLGFSCRWMGKAPGVTTCSSNVSGACLAQCQI
jgi:hypothetical protein